MAETPRRRPSITATRTDLPLYGETRVAGDRDGDERRFWRALVPALKRERLAAALSGDPGGVAGICARRWAGLRNSSSGRGSGRELLAVILTDPAGAQLPLGLRLQIATACTGVSWETAGLESLRLGAARVAELDREMGRLGLPVEVRLAACGFSPWR